MGINMIASSKINIMATGAHFMNKIGEIFLIHWHMLL